MSGPAYATALVPELVAGRLVLETSQGFAIRTQNWESARSVFQLGQELLVLSYVMVLSTKTPNLMTGANWQVDFSPFVIPPKICPNDRLASAPCAPQ